ncbi:MAG: hypothetical protein JWL84_1512 [Rhodospirillales bacterium]|nr:hypothetical protein [Rhodospirillales bacterium]
MSKKKTPTSLYDRLAALPFATRNGKGGKHNYWAVSPAHADGEPGTYAADCNTGHDYAEAMMPLLEEDALLLRDVILSMVRHGDEEACRGLIVGFMSHVIRSFTVGRAESNRMQQAARDWWKEQTAREEANAVAREEAEAARAREARGRRTRRHSTVPAIAAE